MNDILYIVISVLVAACIGGITNYLAIKMLFRPRHAVVIAGRKLPFTPGLIPKRKEEIARSLGRVVGEYLVTSEGLSELLMKPRFRQALENKMKRLLDELSHSEETLLQFAERIWSREKAEQLIRQCTEGLEALSRHGMAWFWDYQERVGLTVQEVIPGWDTLRKQQLTESAAVYILTELRKQLYTPQGHVFLRQLVSRMMEQTGGGVLGAIASVFIDEVKIVSKAKQLIEQQLTSPQLRTTLIDFIDQKVTEWETLKVSDAIHKIVIMAEQHGYGEQSDAEQSDGKQSVADYSDRDWLIERLSSLLKWDNWLAQAGQLELRQLLGEQVKAWLENTMPTLSRSLLHFSAVHIGRIIEVLELPKLVEGQVSKFPIERLEDIVLSVSGREFRAITWLGALLGGMIGLFQAIFILLNVL